MIFEPSIIISIVLPLITTDMILDNVCVCCELYFTVGIVVLCGKDYFSTARNESVARETSGA